MVYLKIMITFTVKSKGNFFCMELKQSDAATLLLIQDPKGRKNIGITTGTIGGVQASFLVYIDKDTEGVAIVKPIAVLLAENPNLFESISDLKVDEVYVSQR